MCCSSQGSLLLCLLNARLWDCPGRTVAFSQALSCTQTVSLVERGRLPECPSSAFDMQRVSCLLPRRLPQIHVEALVHFAWMLGLYLFANYLGFPLTPLKVKLLAKEQKATEVGNCSTRLYLILVMVLWPMDSDHLRFHIRWTRFQEALMRNEMQRK